MHESNARFGIQFVADGTQATPEFQRQIANSKELTAAHEAAAAAMRQSSQGAAAAATSSAATQTTSIADTTRAVRQGLAEQDWLEREHLLRQQGRFAEARALFKAQSELYARGMGLTPGISPSGSGVTGGGNAEAEALAKQTKYVRDEVALMQHEVAMRRMSAKEQLEVLNEMLAGVGNNSEARLAIERSALRASTTIAAEQTALRRQQITGERTDNAELVALSRSRIDQWQHEVAMRRMTVEEQQAALGGLLRATQESATATMAVEREMMRVDEQRTAEAIRNSERRLVAIERDTGQLARVFGRQGGLLRDAFMVAGPVAAITAATEIFRVVSKAAADEEDVLRRLRIAIENQGESWDKVREPILRYAELQERTTKFDQVEVLRAINGLVMAHTGYADALRITRVAEDVAAGTGKSLGEVTHALMLAEHGRYQALTQFGAASRAQIKDGMDLLQTLQALEKGYGGQALRSLEGYTGAADRQKNAAQALGRAWGSETAPAIATFQNATAAALIELNKSSDGTKKSASSLHELDDAGRGVAKMFDLQATAIKAWLAYNIVLPINLANTAWNEFKGTLNATAEAWRRVREYSMTGGWPTPPAAPSSGIAPRSQAAPADAAAIAARAATPQVPAEVLLAIASKESAYGRGLRDGLGDHGHGYGWMQLDDLRNGPGRPFNARPRPQAELDAVRWDPERAMEVARDTIQGLIKQFGDLRSALSVYNTGSVNATGLAYADTVIRKLPRGSQALADLNPVDLHLDRNPSPPSAIQTKEREYRLLADEERANALPDWRQREANRLRELADMEGIARKDHYRLLHEAMKLEEQDRKEADKAMIAQNRITLLTIQTDADNARRMGVSSWREDEIRALQALGAASTTSEKERVAIERRIAQVRLQGERDHETQARKTAAEQQKAWDAEIRAIMASAQAHKSDAESTAILIGKLQELQKIAGVGARNFVVSSPGDAALHIINTQASGAARDRARAELPKIQGMIDASQLADVKLEVTTLEDDARRLYELGEIGRKKYEEMLRSAIGTIAAIKNGGNAAIKDFVDQHVAADTAKLSGFYVQDADEYYKKLGQTVKITNSAIDASSASLAERQLEHLAVIRAQIAALQREAEVYRALGPQGADAYKKVGEQIDALRVSEEQASEKITQDWNAWTSSASGHLEKLLEGGRGTFRGLSDAFKQAIHDMEAALVKSLIAKLLFGSSAGFNFGDVLATSLFGSAMPAQPGSSASASGLTLLGGPAGASNVGITSGPFGPIPTGTQSDPVTVKISAAQLPQLVGSIGGAGGSLAVGGGRVVDNGDGTGTITFGSPGGSSSNLSASAFAIAPLVPVFAALSQQRTTSPASALRAIANASGAAGGGGGNSGLFNLLRTLGGGGSAPAAPSSTIGYGADLGSVGGFNLGAIGGAGYGAPTPVIGAGHDLGSFGGVDLGTIQGSPPPTSASGSGLNGAGARAFMAAAPELYAAYLVSQALSGWVANKMSGGDPAVAARAVAAGKFAGPLGAFIAATFGPHWGPVSNYPDRNPDPQKVFDYGQFSSNINGVPGQFGKQYVSPQIAYDVSRGGSPMYKQMENWANAQTKNLATLSPALRALYDQIIALEAGNPNADFGIIREKNGIDYLANGLQIAVSSYQNLASTWAAAVGADGTKLPIPVFSFVRSMPDWNQGTNVANGMFDPVTGIYTPGSPSTGAGTGNGGTGSGTATGGDLGHEPHLRTGLTLVVDARGGNWALGGVDALTDAVMKRARDHGLGIGGGNRSVKLTV